MTLDQVRAVADAVLYEGYLLYPYRATARKNQVRWQFGVLGPPDAGAEEPSLATQCLLTTPPATTGPPVRVHLRFLQLQARTVERYDAAGGFVPVEELVAGGQRWLSWDEAVERHVTLDYAARELWTGAFREVTVPGGEEVEDLAAAPGEPAARVVRRRWPLRARVTATATGDDGWTRLEVRVDNLTPAPPGPGSTDPARASLIGTHLILEADGARFVSLTDPPPAAAAAARRCTQQRCWPVLAGPRPDGRSGDQATTSSVVLAAPIILYDFPEVAEQSAGDLFDATEIDEILTLRVMAMTEEEKTEARATDPRAREIIDRCDRLSPASLQQLHGVLRAPDAPWWDPAAAEAVHPERDSVLIDGVAVSAGSLVRLHPSRRADAQDLFLAGRVARVTAVVGDVDGEVHVAVVLADDPDADLHEWYGRYWYFAPDELQPLSRPAAARPAPGEESPS